MTEKADILDDLGYLLLVLPMIEAQRDIVLKAIAEIKELRQQIDLVDMDRDRG